MTYCTVHSLEGQFNKLSGTALFCFFGKEKNLNLWPLYFLVVDILSEFSNNVLIIVATAMVGM